MGEEPLGPPVMSLQNLRTYSSLSFIPGIYSFQCSNRSASDTITFHLKPVLFWLLSPPQALSLSLLAWEEQELAHGTAKARAATEVVPGRAGGRLKPSTVEQEEGSAVGFLSVD